MGTLEDLFTLDLENGEIIPTFGMNVVIHPTGHQGVSLPIFCDGDLNRFERKPSNARIEVDERTTIPSDFSRYQERRYKGGIIKRIPYQDGLEIEWRTDFELAANHQPTRIRLAYSVRPLNTELLFGEQDGFSHITLLKNKGVINASSLFYSYSPREGYASPSPLEFEFDEQGRCSETQAESSDLRFSKPLDYEHIVETVLSVLTADRITNDMYDTVLRHDMLNQYR